VFYFYRLIFQIALMFPLQPRFKKGFLLLLFCSLSSGDVSSAATKKEAFCFSCLVRLEEGMAGMI